MTHTAHIKAPPTGSTIELVEATDQRLVIVIPPGSGAGRRMGRFAVIWLLITSLVGGGFLAAFFDKLQFEGDAPPIWFIGPFLGLFFAVGLFLGYVSLRMSRTRLFVALERHQLALRDEFLGRSKTSVLPLDSSSRASLEEAYSEGDQPVYRVIVTGIDTPTKFGTGCSDTEKAWLVQTINQFLGVSKRDEPESSSEQPIDAPDDGSGAELRDELADAAPSFLGSSIRRIESAASITPTSLPESSRIRVNETEPGLFEVSYLVLTSRKPLLLPFVIVGTFELLWVGMILSIVATAVGGDGDALKLIGLFGVIMIAIGLAPMVLLSMVMQTRVTISITADAVIARIGAGTIGWHRAIPLESVLDVGIGQVQDSPGSTPGRRKLLSGLVAVIWSNHTTLPVAVSEDREFLTLFTSLIRYGLNQFRK